METWLWVLMSRATPTEGTPAAFKAQTEVLTWLGADLRTLYTRVPLGSTVG